MPRASWTTLAATLVAALALAAPASAADGDLDTSFAEDGISHLERGRYAKVALQSDGKLIVAGNSFGQEGEGVVGRLTAAGSPDPGFGEGGYTVLAPSSQIQISDVAIDPDGRAVVAATRNGGMGVLYRLTSTGELDPSFDGDGIATFRYEDDYSYVYAIDFQADGRIVAAGESFHEPTSESSVGVARFDTDGSLDETFAGDGTTVFEAGHAETAWHVMLQGGRIVVAGVRGPPAFPHLESWAARVEADGTLDETFGTGGVFATNAILGEDAIMTAGGGVLFAGTGLNEGSVRDTALLKLDANGDPDEGFAPGGRWTHDVIPGSSERGLGLAASHAGDFTVAVSGGNRLAAVKVSPAGALVPGFGDGGERVYESIGQFDSSDALRQPDGKFVVGGDDGEGMAVVRIHDTPPPAPPAPEEPAATAPPAPLPILTLTAGRAVEGQVLPFTATLSRPSDQPVSFGYFTGEGTAAGGRDFGQRSGTVTIPPGQTSATIGIPTNEDRLFETEETFRVELHGATNARFGEYVAFGTIVNDLRPGRCQNIVQGRRGTDILTGSSAGDLIVGRQDVDFLFGLGGPDCIRGERGGDIIDGGDGDDTVDGGSGDDRMKGGDGDDRLYGRRGRNRYNGGKGNDRIYARNGIAEIVECGAGRDRVKADSGDRLRRCEIVTR